MKVIIQHKSKPHTGKGNFVSRLIPALEALGVTVIGDTTEKADIALHIGRKHYYAKVRRDILRVGPACVDTNKNYKAINKEKADSVKACNAVIYQSLYSKKVYHHLVCNPNIPETVILNGAPPKEIPCAKMGHPCFLASTRRWWPQKRLKYTIKAFNEAAIPESTLYIAGDYSMTKWAKKPAGKGVQFLGLISQEKLDYYRSVCNAHFHLTWLDACPNSVVESLVAGCPVVCTNAGGTGELISCDDNMNSVILDVDPEYKYKPVNLNKPPKIDVNELVTQFYLYSVKFQSSHAHKLDIKVIAQQYKDFFELCLS